MGNDRISNWLVTEINRVGSKISPDREKVNEADRKMTATMMNTKVGPLVKEVYEIKGSGLEGSLLKDEKDIELYDQMTHVVICVSWTWRKDIAWGLAVIKQYFTQGELDSDICQPDWGVNRIRLGYWDMSSLARNERTDEEREQVRNVIFSLAFDMKKTPGEIVKMLCGMFDDDRKRMSRRPTYNLFGLDDMYWYKLTPTSTPSKVGMIKNIK